MSETARRITVSGVVQGVGFRPFLYSAATASGLYGTVQNTSVGVVIEVEGDEADIQRFIGTISNEHPPIARITSLETEDITSRGIEGFSILESCGTGSHFALIPPDTAVCEECLKEFHDPSDRRYRYPFINCTDCGPRYTITENIPYDRHRTAMKAFPMCPKCRKEYEDPHDRRFHTQAICCPDCGPHFFLTDRNGNSLTEDDSIIKAIEYLRQGKIVAVKGIGGFHLAIDATNNDAVKLLRKRKGRPTKPFAVMFSDIDTVRKFARISVEESRLLMSPQRPIVVLESLGNPLLGDAIAPLNPTLGCMLPYAPVHYRLFEDGGFDVLVMTSGNYSDEPLVIGNDEALSVLSSLADFFLMNDRDILTREDDSIVRNTRYGAMIIRRARGFVPDPLKLPRTYPEILACGGELKNTVCINRSGEAFLSQHMGDMESERTLNFFEDTVKHLSKYIGVEPEVIVHDDHPDYLSTKWALEQKAKRRISVQHHEAHLAACLGEWGEIDREVIGFSMDGSGYGSDGNIWGGEIFTGRLHEFERSAHFEYVVMPGGDMAVKEPWRMALAYLYHAFGQETTKYSESFMSRHQDKADTVLKIIEKRIRSPFTSSLGRLFDGIGSLAGLVDIATYEGEGAVMLEMSSSEDTGKQYTFEIREEEDVLVIGIATLIRSVADDIKKGSDCGEISSKFHRGIITIFAKLAEQLREKTGIGSVALSGGCFQNRILLEGLTGELEENGFEVFYHRNLPPGDGSLSFGQLIIAGERGEAKG